jgi:predicted phosphodiesterase
VAGPATYTTALGDVQLAVHPAWPGDRGVNLYVPLADWGLRARITGAPVAVAAEPRRIDRDGLVDIVTEGSPFLRPLRKELADDLRAAAIRAALVALAGGIAGGLLGILVWERLGVRGRRLLLAPAAGAGVALAFSLVLAGWSAASWEPERLERPTYYASGTELQRLLDQADTLRRTGQKYASRVDVAIRSIAGLLDEGPRQGTDPGGTRIMLASDIHNNVLTLPVLRRFGAQHPTILAGDFTINGSRLEAGLLRGLEHLGKPVVAVSGNHDSPGLMRRLGRRGIIVLDHRDGVREIAGLRMAGFEDPLAYVGRGFPSGVRTGLSFGDLPDGHERFQEAVEDRWAWWTRLPERPQVLVVHQEAIARALAGLIWNADPDGPAVTILAGHTHRQRLDRYGPVTVVNGGTAGAGGLFGTGRDPVGFALLDLTAHGTLEATDLVQQDPTDGSAQARRVITAEPDCDQRLVFCHAEPELPELPGAPITGPTGPRAPGER